MLSFSDRKRLENESSTSSDNLDSDREARTLQRLTSRSKVEDDYEYVLRRGLYLAHPNAISKSVSFAEPLKVEDLSAKSSKDHSFDTA